MEVGYSCLQTRQRVKHWMLVSFEEYRIHMAFLHRTLPFMSFTSGSHLQYLKQDGGDARSALQNTVKVREQMQ